MKSLLSKLQSEREKRQDTQQKEIENANHIILRFSLLYYFILLCGTLLQYGLSQDIEWSIPYFWMLVVILLLQMLGFTIWKSSLYYGNMTMLTATVLFTYVNIVSKDALALLLFMPMVTLCMLYMRKWFLGAVYVAWGINMIIRAVDMMNRGILSDRESEREWGIIVVVCVFFALSSYMVNCLVSHQYHTIYHSLKKENKLHTQLYQQSAFDSATGLQNRNAYNRYLEEYDPVKQDNMSCIYIDVNGLHEYNNTYGHLAGDKMLNMVATMMKKNFPEQELYRIGGDEFIVIGENISFQTALERLKTFREQVKAHNIHIASGLEWRDENMDLEDMIKAADEKMYQDKEVFYRNGDVRRRAT